MKCPHCGYETHSGRTHCPACGERLAQDAKRRSGSRNLVVDVDRFDAGYDDYDAPLPHERKAAKRNSGIPGLIAVVMVAVLLLGGGGLLATRLLSRPEIGGTELRAAAITPTPAPTKAPRPTRGPVETPTPRPTATATPETLGRTQSTPTPAPTKAPRPTRQPVGTPTPRPTATATPRPTATPQPTATPAPTLTPPAMRVTTQADFSEVFRWMLDNHITHVELDALTLSSEQCTDAMNDFCTYVRSYYYENEPDRGVIDFDPEYSTAIIWAIEDGTMDQLDAETRALADQALALAKQLIRPGMSDYEKELAIHDYIVNHCDYEIDVLGHHTADARGFFQYGKCQCAGYADTFYLVGTLAGLEIDFVSGEITESGNGHSWNLVRLDGLWYAVDVTWDDPTGDTPTLRYDYFNLPACYLAKTRTWRQVYCPAGRYAEALDDNYYYTRAGASVSGKRDSVAASIAQIDQSGKAVILLMDPSVNPKSINQELASHYNTTSWYTSSDDRFPFTICEFWLS